MELSPARRDGVMDAMKRYDATDQYASCRYSSNLSRLTYPTTYGGPAPLPDTVAYVLLEKLSLTIP